MRLRMSVFSLQQGETLAIVGESGSGKSVTCYSLLGLLPMPPAHITAGTAVFNIAKKANSDTDTDRETDNQYEQVDLLAYYQHRNKSNSAFLRTQQIATIFQDPNTSLNPYLSIGEQLIEPLIYKSPNPVNRQQASEKALALLNEVGIRNPQQCFDSWPHQMSGGMNQRVMIAMALIGEPQVLIADEPTTALDVTIQAQILDLLDEIQQRRGISIIFISHDLSVVSNIADHILVMNKGEVVEQGTPQEIFHNTQHSYTKALIDAIPSNNTSKKHTDASESQVLPQVQPLLKIANLSTVFGRAGQH